jgi:hypothetical protein
VKRQAWLLVLVLRCFVVLLSVLLVYLVTRESAPTLSFSPAAQDARADTPETSKQPDADHNAYPTLSERLFVDIFAILALLAAVPESFRSVPRRRRAAYAVLSSFPHDIRELIFGPSLPGSGLRPPGAGRYDAIAATMLRKQRLISLSIPTSNT